MTVGKTLELDYALNDKQWEFHESEAKYKGFIGGIGSGKTWMGCLEAILAAISQPGIRIMIVAPSYKMMRDSTYMTFKDICPSELILNESEVNREITLAAMDTTTGKGGTSLIMFRSADDPDALRGPSLSMVVLDEASKMAAVTWQIIIGRLRQPGPYKRVALALTTPKGRNWLWRVFVKDATKETSLTVCPTTVNRDNLPEGFIESLEQQYVGVFKRQELMGEFVSFEGRVYENFDQTVHVVDPDNMPTPDRFKRIIAGVDWGFTNPMAVVIIGIDGDGRLYIPDELYKKRLVPEQITQECLAIEELWRPDTWFCDPSEPQYIQMLRNEGINAVPSENEVMAGITKVASYFPRQADGRTRIQISRSCPNLISELDQYAYPENKENRAIKEKPMPINDHLCVVGNTLITTPRGDMRIKDITPGMHVLTRKGPREVLFTSETVELVPVVMAHFSDGSRVVGTPDHPIITQRGLATPLNKLENGEFVWAARYSPPKVKMEKKDEPMLAARLTPRGVSLDFINRNDLHIMPVGSSDIVRFIKCYPYGEAKVYNLTVAHDAEYFTNGILSHNCDALRYAIYSKDMVVPVTPEQKKDKDVMSFGGQFFW